MKRKTVGVSPKVSVPSSVLVLAGAVLATLDAVGVLNVDDSVWIAVLGAGGVTFGTGYAADPGRVREEHGYGVVELLLVIFLVLIILLVLFRLM